MAYSCILWIFWIFFSSFFLIHSQSHPALRFHSHSVTISLELILSLSCRSLAFFLYWTFSICYSSSLLYFTYFCCLLFILSSSTFLVFASLPSLSFHFRCRLSFLVSLFCLFHSWTLILCLFYTFFSHFFSFFHVFLFFSIFLTFYSFCYCIL